MITRRQVLCKNCGHWNISAHLSPHCSQCGIELFPVSKEEEESLERRRQTWDIRIPIHPNEPWPVRWMKHVANSVQLVFMGIVSFIIWLFAMSPG